MSGGTIKPNHFRIKEMIESIRDNTNDPWHLIFADHLEKVAAAVRMLDRELSSNIGEGEASESIRLCLNDADLLAYSKMTIS